MQTNKKNITFLLLLSMFIIGCKKSESKIEITSIKDTTKIVEKQEFVSPPLNERNNYTNESFVISCGSGCAMNYAPEDVTKKDKTIKVKFNVKMYINEALSDTYYETYIFYYDNNNKLDNIKLEGKSENILKTLMPDAQDSFKNFGAIINNELIPSNNLKDSCFQTSKVKLPYNELVNIKTVKYNLLSCNSIKGIEKYNCGENKLRYLSLPSKGDISVILVPQDCGDFNYRYYLLSVKNNVVIGDLYVEGEWYEPENFNEKEATSFSIDEEYNIIVKTISSKSTLKNSYILENDGKIVKKS